MSVTNRRWAAHGRVRDLALRVVRLHVGLAGFGVSLALMVRARLGLDPWDVLHQGIARLLEVRLGWVVIAVSLMVLAAWIPLRQRPGFGTVSNAVVVGLVVNVAVAVIPSPRALVARAVMLAVAIVLNGISTGLYIGAGLGPGPRDGLMTGLAARGHSIRAVRTIIEVSALAIGFALGGSVGIGTIAYAASIGPLVHLFLPRLTLPSSPRRCPSEERQPA
ncbi:MAG TPA: hypothetical protein VF162_22210 [Streptosporangiaceae bacterium]